MNRDRHIAKAEHNKEFAQKVLDLGEEYQDWALTAIFYSALHYVDAMLGDRGATVSTHHERDKAVARNLQFLRKDYKNLERKAIDARYEDESFSEQDLGNCMRRLERIEQRAIEPFSTANRSSR